MVSSFRSFLAVGLVVVAPLTVGSALAQTMPDVLDVIDPVIDVVDPVNVIDPVVDLVAPVAPDTINVDVDMTVDLTDLSGVTTLRDMINTAIANRDFDGDGIPGDIANLDEFKALMAERFENGELQIDQDKLAALRERFGGLEGGLGGGLGGALGEDGGVDLVALRETVMTRLQERGFDPSRLDALRERFASGGFGHGGLPTDGAALEGAALGGGFDPSTLLGALGGLGGAGGAGGVDLGSLGAGAGGGFDPSALLGALGGLGGAGGAGGLDLGALGGGGAIGGGGFDPSALLGALGGLQGGDGGASGATFDPSTLFSRIGRRR
ncbi:MAG: hypothetical protein ABF335_03245 [Alphaproteobacteria bacterium]